MNLTYKRLLITITIIVVLPCAYFAAETIIAEDENGRHIVDKSRCNEELYYQYNETECDGFVYWAMACSPFLVAISLVWASVLWTSRQRVSKL